MARRSLILWGELDLFKEFLQKHDFLLEDTKGKYEILRAKYIGKPQKHIVYKSQNKPLIIYFREKGIGYTLTREWENSGLFTKEWIDYKKVLDAHETYIKGQKEIKNILKNL